MSASARTIVRYLLGELSDSARAALEAEYVTDSRLFDRMVETENDLVDAYARGRLSRRMRARFEQSYLAAPPRRERAKFAEALAARLDRVEAPRVARRGRPAFVGLALAATLLLVAAAGIRWFTESRRVREQVAQTEPPPTIQPPPATPTPPARVPAPTVVTLLLTVSDVRAADPGSPKTLVVPPATEQVRIQLTQPADDYPRYTAILRRVGGVEIFSRQGLRPGRSGSAAVFEFAVPARELATGDYILTLKGVRSTGEIEDLSMSIFHVDNAPPR